MPTREQDEKRECEIREVLHRIKLKYEAEAKPYVDELIEIYGRKPLSPIRLPDGRIAFYKGSALYSDDATERAPDALGGDENNG